MPPIVMSIVTLPKTLLPCSFFSALSSFCSSSKGLIAGLCVTIHCDQHCGGQGLTCAAGILSANAALRLSPAAAEK
jgi:hypothetical protein